MQPFHLHRRLLGLASLFIGVCLSANVWASTPKLVKKVPPEFPREAVQQGINSGSVKAKMNIDPDGKVASVEILEAEPRRVFDKAVMRALTEWRFEASGEKQVHEVKLVFKNED